MGELRAPDTRSLTCRRSLFVDNDLENVREVAQALPQTCVLHVPREVDDAPFVRQLEKARGGIQAAQHDIILRWARNRKGGSLFEGPTDEQITERSTPPQSNASSPFGGGACSQFVPKRPSGPLARRCFHCNQHEMVHLHECTEAPTPTIEPAAVAPGSD